MFLLLHVCKCLFFFSVKDFLFFKNFLTLDAKVLYTNHANCVWLVVSY